jgi:hypothetical protein
MQSLICQCLFDAMHKAFEAVLKKTAENCDPEATENAIALFAAENLSEAE